jgi:hypothetical protein
MKLADTIISSHTCTLEDRFNEGQGKVQTASIQLVCRYSIVQQLTAYGGRNGLLVALCPSNEGTVASSVQATADSLIVDDSFDKYWFTKTAVVSINSGPGMSIGNEGPGTTPMGHQVSSSISINAGFFGDMPTGGVAYTSSSSISLPDFAVLDQSQNSSGTLHHYYGLAATSGGAFTDDKDMFSTVLDMPYEPPALAKTNLPIPSQGFWICNEGFNGVSNVSITVTHTLLAVDVTYINVPPEYAWLESSYSSTINLPAIDWSQVKPPKA